MRCQDAEVVFRRPHCFLEVSDVAQDAVDLLPLVELLFALLGLLGRHAALGQVDVALQVNTDTRS